MKNNNPRHQEFLIADIMPRREVHLLCGPSGVGKTNLSLAGLKELQRGGEWLGKKVLQPVKIFYLSADRSSDSVRRAFDRHSIPHDSFPWNVGKEIRGTSGVRIYDILSWIHSNYPDVEFIFIDGFAYLLGGNLNDYKEVVNFLNICRDACTNYNLSVLGSVHSPKLRLDESIPNPRQQVMGSVAWPGTTDLIISLQPEDAEDVENPNRICHVLPRDAAEYVLHFRNTHGILLPVDQDEEKDQCKNAEREIELAAPGTTWSTQDLQSMLVVPKTSFHRWLSFAVASGLLQKVSRGTYRRFA